MNGHALGFHPQTRNVFVQYDSLILTLIPYNSTQSQNLRWFKFPLPSSRYWPVIDDALRRAAFDRKVKVRLLASLWNHTRPDMKFYLQSLAALNGANDASVQVVRHLIQPPRRVLFK